jgi:homeobox protein cut-like
LLQTAKAQLESTSQDLEKQRALNEKLETDLLSLNQHQSNGDSIQQPDVLDSLDLGKKTVSQAVCAQHPASDGL